MTHSIQEDLDWLDGAEVVKIEPGQIGLKLWLHLPQPVLLTAVDQEVEYVAFEVWSDEEGNNAGHLALVEFN